MTTSKIDFEKFNGNNDFNMWKVKVEALLVNQGLGDTLKRGTKNKGKETSSSKTEQKLVEKDKKAMSIIILSLVDLVIMEVTKEENICIMGETSQFLHEEVTNLQHLHQEKNVYTKDGRMIITG